MELTLMVALRAFALGILLYTSFFGTFYQLVCAAVCFSGYLLLQKPRGRLIVINSNEKRMKNPLKGKPSSTTELSPELSLKIQKAVTDLVTYDAEEAESLSDFHQIKTNTECIFAKKSRLWGTPVWRKDLSIEENAFRFVPTFLKFTMCCDVLGLDGFLVQLPDEYSSDIKTFGGCVRRLLRAVSGQDPRGLDCMRHTQVDRRGWVFRFYTQTFFITTFAPFYPTTHSRHSFGSRCGYVLFQPEISFAQHNIPEDSPHTNWTKPSNVRDRIRVAFKEAGRGYRIRETVNFPMAYEIVKPIDEHNAEYFEWWNPVES